jgi:thiamine biosynthesis lipoprotein
LNRLTVSKLIALSVGLICIFSAYYYNKSATYQISGPIYGTYWQLVSTEYIPDSLKQSIEVELARIDLIASNYKESSELSRINAAPIDVEIIISPEMYSILSYAEKLYQLTAGLYDVTVGSLVIDKGFGPEDSMNQNTIPVSLKRFDLISNNAIIKNDNFQFDLSSIAKGYAVDSVAELLINANRKNFLIDIGGEIIVNGTKHGAPWVIGIQDPSSLQNKSILEILENDFLACCNFGRI